MVACHTEQENSSTPAIAGVMLGSAWRYLANECKRERAGVGMGVFLSALQCSDMSFQVRCISFPT